MYVQTEYWKQIVKAAPTEMLEEWVAADEKSIPELKEIASHGDPDSPIYKYIESKESDLAFHKAELDRRMAEKGA